MEKSLESGIRFKAVVIYVIVALGIIGIMGYLNNLRKNFSSQRLEIENQQILLSAANDLMFAVSEAQSSATLYISTKENFYLTQYNRSIDSIEKWIDVIVALKPNEELKLSRILSLIREQSQNVKNLNLQFAERNPVELINEWLLEYEPSSKEDTIYALSIRRDTVMSEKPRRGILKRIAEVFIPDKDSVRMVVNQWTDTIRTLRSDSLAIIYEVGEITQEAQKTYERNIKLIEKQVVDVISYHRDITLEVSALLLEFHKETLNATLSIFDQSERSIRRNYLYSIIGGGLALVFILLFIILIITDINKGRAARLALEVANERTRQIMESRHRLLLSVSHDIKSPLNSILGYLSLMKSDTTVRSMQNSSEHILSMLENLLEFSTIEQGKLLKNVQNFNILELLKDIYEMFVPLAGQKNLTFTYSADNVRIQTDRVKLKQVVINLVSNAIKYTKSGSVVFSIKVEKSMLVFIVEDTGVGISEEKLPQIFMPFVRFEGDAIASGTGLGMYVVKGLVDLLEGKIDIHSKVGEGTVIEVILPVELSQNEIPQGAKNIKVYDDDPVVIKMVSEMLLRLGHQVVEHDYDLILTDIEMGDISGFDILRNTRGATPVVAMTGRSDFSTQKAIELGFNQFLAKPVTIDSLREIVGEGDSVLDLFGDDRDEIIALFRTSVEENYSLLRQALTTDNFQQAQATCHKMFPMFAQMGYPTGALRKIDAHRNNEYKGWQEDVKAILSISM